MCLELMLEVLLVVSIVNGQLYQSPCPETFRYERDENGELYGMVGVYSFDENVDLNVELSVGNKINNYNGQIRPTISNDAVAERIRNRRPIHYKIYFPRWENVPPKITRISVNGQQVCSGPPLQFNEWITVLSSVNLSHRFTKVTPLGFQSPPTTNVITPGIKDTDFQYGGGNTKNPFLYGTTGIRDFNDLVIKTTTGPPRRTTTRRWQTNPFFSGDFDDDFTTRPTTRPTTRRTTTRRRRPTTQDNDLFSDNPFFTRRPSTLPPRQTTAPPPPPIEDTFRPEIDVRDLDVCGNPVVANQLIFNGISVPRGAFPWLTALFGSTGVGVEYKCCGTLVSAKHVITAAHCVTLQRSTKPIPYDKLLFVFGKLNIQNILLGDDEQMAGADNITIHPDYRPLSADADIAVVLLTKTIKFTNNVRPICLWTGSSDLNAVVNQRGKVVGWGRDEKNNAMTAEPRQVTIPIVSQEKCRWSAEVFTYFTSDRTFCAGDRNDTGPCNGDSGSGFVMKRDNRWYLRGIVSLSSYDANKQTCDLSNYVVFTDVTKFQSWLSLYIVN